MSMNNQEIMERAQSWAHNTYFDQESRQEIQHLIDNGQHQEITERFYTDLEFGTGGLRGIIGMGSNRINKYNVRKAAQALALVLKEGATAAMAGAQRSEKLLVVMAHDSRKFSREFTLEAASVLAANGIKVLIFTELTPVPLLSFAVRYKRAQAGMMITASHNPKEYNGCKMYWSDGCQVIPPNDRHIITAYQTIADFNSIKYMPEDLARKEGLIGDLEGAVEDAYHQHLLEKSFQRELCRERGREIKIVYTPLHGSGLRPCVRALKELGLSNYLLVPGQDRPDSAFSTLTTPPNPEIPAAMKMATDLMMKEGADLAFATDPDSDRLGVALPHKGQTLFLNGNQLAVLLLHYILEQTKLQGLLKEKQDGAPPFLVVKSIVTSELLTTIANSYGVSIVNTLTGFKWICGYLTDLERQGKKYRFLFACEESFGYLPHDQVRDKDGVAALAFVAEMGLWYKLKGMDLMDALDSIYDQFGFAHETLLSLDYEGKEGALKIDRIMETFRSPTLDQVCGEKILVKEDYLAQASRNLVTGERHPLDLPKSNVIGLVLESGNKIFLRPSGTEPKIKFYVMIQSKEGDLAAKKEAALIKATQYEAFLREKAAQA